jgi:hypothetical protein
MRHRFAPYMILAGLAAFAGAGTFAVRTAAQDNAAQDNAASADETPQPFNPQLAALMIMLIQPRHAKIALAGKAENWALAGYEFKQLQQAFQVIPRAVPRYKGLPVAELVDAALKQPFAVLDFAIKAGDARQFNESFEKVTAGCNACHATTDNAMVVIKVPTADMFPNQEFQPGKR